ncbi:unnamed protein product [Timema podura]|uniref:Uncharacterized protein n=1 Tax=Timema podura TaxID=61482 RepID=A0ABN7NG40_TIMPD|nr:unnamed protein product [Timema podura]
MSPGVNGSGRSTGTVPKTKPYDPTRDYPGAQRREHALNHVSNNLVGTSGGMLVVKALCAVRCQHILGQQDYQVCMRGNIGGAFEDWHVLSSTVALCILVVVIIWFVWGGHRTASLDWQPVSESGHSRTRKTSNTRSSTLEYHDFASNVPHSNMDGNY